MIFWLGFLFNIKIEFLQNILTQTFNEMFLIKDWTSSVDKAVSIFGTHPLHILKSDRFKNNQSGFYWVDTFFNTQSNWLI